MRLLTAGSLVRAQLEEPNKDNSFDTKTVVLFLGSLSIVVVKKIRTVIDNRIMIIIGLAKQGRFCMRKREEYAF